MAPVGTLQILLSGTCKKHIYPGSPREREPRAQTGTHTSLLQPARVKPCPQVQAAQVSPASSAWLRLPGAPSRGVS